MWIYNNNIYVYPIDRQISREFNHKPSKALSVQKAIENLDTKI